MLEGWICIYTKTIEKIEDRTGEERRGGENREERIDEKDMRRDERRVVEL